MSSYRSGPRDALILAIIVSSVLLGGSGSFYPATELACAIIVTTFCYLAWAMESRVPNTRAMWFCALLLVLPALQLVPLPPLLWHQLPGREAVKEALAAVGRPNSWQPLSIAPSLTWRSLLFTAAPLSALLVVSTLDEARRRTVLAGVALACALSAFVGFLQATAPTAGLFDLYRGSDATGARFIFGLNANHNATADQMLIGMMAAGAWFASFKRRENAALRWLLIAACDIVFISAAVFTGSRTGIALLPIAIIVQGAMLLKGRPLPSPRLVIGGAAILAILAIAIWVSADKSLPLQIVMGRFSTLDDFRAEIWEDTLAAIRNYQWAGSGFGTLVPALQQAERLEVINTTFTLHAHDEYLEYTLETGIFGWITLASAFFLLARGVVTSWVGADVTKRREMLFFFGTLLVMAIHSLVDHPFRNMALVTMLALATGLVFGAPRNAAETEKAS